MAKRSWTHLARLVAVLALLGVGTPLLDSPAQAAPSSRLTRYPYLTDSIQSSITVNWATDTSKTSGSVRWGRPGDCTDHSVTASRTSITVVEKAEYQWKATIPVSPDTDYCYRVMLSSTDLLGSDVSPAFTSQVAAGSSKPFSFAVFGDSGVAYDNGENVDQANMMTHLANSGARFAIFAGDIQNSNGTQTNYGDLQQRAEDVSGIFGPSFWTVPGRSIPAFNVTGNHGFTNGAVQVLNWPEENAASTSSGKYLMEPYPSINGSTPKNYPSMWYAFDAGPARFYLLTASWADMNIGSGSVYKNDHDAHWTTNSPQYKWLKQDLEAHPNAIKLAFWHYPLYADSASQGSDTFLQGGDGTLQGLLNKNKVAAVFNGHAHLYQRNRADAAGMRSYVFGIGGAELGTVSGCSATDLFGLGDHETHCGAAPSGLSDDHVYGFGKVTINGRQITVAPTDELGRTFDVQTFTAPK